jgi:PAS domain S-box-containing protein
VYLLRLLHVRDPAVSIFLNALGVSVWYGGKGPGIAAGALSLIALNFYVNLPTGWFHIGLSNIPYFCVFLGTGWLLYTFSRSVQKQLADRTAVLTRINLDYESIFNNVEVAIALLDPDSPGHMIRRCNCKFEEMFGASTGELIGKSAPWPARENTTWEQIYTQLRSGISIHSDQMHQIRLDGTGFFARISISPVLDEAGAYVGAVLLIIDNTEQQRAEEELRRRDLHLSEAQAISHTGSWVWNESTQQGFWSEELFRILGLEPGAVVPGPDEYFRRIHPEDRSQLEESWRIAVREQSSFDLMHRVVRPDGSRRHVRTLGRSFPVSREELEFLGSVVDVTEQYEDRCKLEKSLTENQRLLEENIALRERSQEVAETLRDETAALQKTQFERIVGSSPALRRTLELVKRVASTDATVLLMGETGTGKELIAQAIHQHSARANRLYRKFDCAAYPSTLVASELFGAEKGAYTGIDRRRAGHVEVVEGGTLFLDEVGELSMEAQQHLLRLLQDRVFERLGSTRVIPADVRIIAATNRDLKAAMQANTFRPDLYYRLNVYPIHVPPLRDRKEDIPELVQQFLRELAAKHGKPVFGITNRDLALLSSYDWPGNVRELQNVIERAVIASSGSTLTLDAESFLSANGTEERSGVFWDELDNLARTMIERALSTCGGQVDGEHGAARVLGMSPGALRARVSNLGIDHTKFRRR